MIFCEPQIKPSLEWQALSRVYRMGQVQNVLVCHLLCENTVDEAVRAILARKEEEVVEGIAFVLHLLVRGHNLLQVAAQHGLVVARIVCRHEDAARIPGRLYVLGALFRQIVIEVSQRIAVEEFEVQRRRVVVAVGSDRRLDHREGVLVHLESRGHVLALPDPHHGDVADEDHSFEGRFLARQRCDAGLHLFRRGPVAGEHQRIQPFGYQLVAVGIHFSLACGIGSIVDENGKRSGRLGRFRSGAEGSCAQQDAQHHK